MRAFAPGIDYEPRTLSLPVDFRACRSHRCADAADRRGADVWRSPGGRAATAFTHVVDRRAGGDDLFIQYWLYYPDSNSVFPGSRQLWTVARVATLGQPLPVSADDEQGVVDADADADHGRELRSERWHDDAVAQGRDDAEPDHFTRRRDDVSAPH